jgi:hypothetical protein
LNQFEDAPFSNPKVTYIQSKEKSCQNNFAVVLSRGRFQPESFQSERNMNMKNHFSLRCLAAVLLFVGWSALQSWGATELIQNGGFESGDAGWTMEGSPYLATSDNTPGYSRSGSWYLWLGGVASPSNPFDDCYQLVTIPPLASSATLSFWYNIESVDTGTAHDFFLCRIRDTNDTVLATLLQLDNRNRDAGVGPAYYHHATFDLLPYKGQPIKIQFESSNNSTAASSFDVDDVSLQVVVSTTPPGNDTCAGAIPLVGGEVSTTNTANATSTGDPVPGCQGSAGKGVWYTYTPASSGTVSVSTCGSTYDTVLAVYSGSCGSLTPVACNDDNGPSCPGSQASVSFSVTGGTTYYILAAGSGGATGILNIMAIGPLTGLIINPTWDSTILNDPNAAAIMNTINNAILIYETKYSDPVTVNITFAEGGTLGMSSTFYSDIPYTTFYNALVGDSKTTNDLTALSHIPLNGGIDPVDNHGSIRVTTANQRAIGLSANPPSDGTIYVNVSACNLDRISIDINKYDLMSVVSHEIDEVMGTSSSLGAGDPEPFSRPADLFRYNSAGDRTYVNFGDDSWFSIDGTNRLVQYNQIGGADYGDWWSAGVHTPRVQDAFGTTGATPNLGVELTLLDVIGWDLVAGTLPPPVIPTIKSVTRSGNTINFSWASAAGRSYQVQYRTNLTQVGWLNLNSPITAVGTTTSSSDTMGPGPRRFYRISLVPSSPAPPTIARVNGGSTGPFSVATRYFLPQRAAEIKGEAAKSLPAARPLKGTVRVQAQEQK